MTQDEAAKPILWLIRGLPGAGKSTYARKLGCLVLEPEDNYATVGGEYRWRERFIGYGGAVFRTPAWNMLKEVLQAVMGRGCDVAVAEVLPDVPEWMTVFASHFKYELRVVHLLIAPEVSARRNTHNVTLRTARSMARKWRPFPGEIVEVVNVRCR